MIKIILYTAVMGLALLPASAQKKMLSPHAEVKGSIDGVQVAVDYHRPSARKREIMGSLVPYGKVWRTGANNTTSIKFDAPVNIEGEKLEKGTYGLYTIPGENEWVIIFNQDIKWGAYDYSKKNDVLRVRVKPKKTTDFFETFTISIEEKGVLLQWENTSVMFSVSKG